MASNRWDVGAAESGADFDEGFISPWNGNVREFSDYAHLVTIPAASIPATMSEQMDGDANTTFTGGGGRRRRRG